MFILEIKLVGGNFSKRKNYNLISISATISEWLVIKVRK